MITGWQSEKENWERKFGWFLKRIFKKCRTKNRISKLNFFIQTGNSNFFFYKIIFYPKKKPENNLAGISTLFFSTRHELWCVRFLIDDLEIFDFLTVSVMCDGNNSLWSGSELGVQNQNGHDDHQSYHSSSKAVNNQGFGNKIRYRWKDIIGDFFSSWSQSLGAIIVGVHEVRHPFVVGNTKGSAKVGNSG